MHCPKCGQEQVSEAVRFCSRCGFSLAGVAMVLANNGEIPEIQKISGMSKRKRGIMQGIFIFLLTFLVVPVITLITIALNAEPFAVVLSAVLLTMGGLLRIAYALMFEPAEPEYLLSEAEARARISIAGTAIMPERSLNEQRDMPASGYVHPSTGSWRDTNDMEPHPGSVVEITTRHLEEKLPDQ